MECDAVVTDPPYFRVKGEAWDRQWDNASAFLDFIGERVTAWHRDLRANGSLYCFASPKMAARVECKIGERFNVLNTITWAKPPYSTKAEMCDKPTMRAFFPASERIIFAEHYGADNMAKGEAGYQAKCDELRGFVFEPLRAYLDGERIRAGAGLTELAEALGWKDTRLRHCFCAGKDWWRMVTPEGYAELRAALVRLSHGGSYLERPYEDLRREYKDLRREYEALRRPFAVSSAVPYTDVWTFPTVPAYKGKHPCEKPLALLEHILTASTRPGAIVRDDFIEKDASYFDAARQRLENELRQGRLPFAPNTADMASGGKP
jgi:site-specific DNA-methyltransferase (adenine-specific)